MKQSLRCIVMILLCAAATATGCRHHRWASTPPEGESRQPIVGHNVGRAADQRGQVGIDYRAREIEASLGVGE